jgi:hypothetical protein
MDNKAIESTWYKELPTKQNQDGGAWRLKTPGDAAKMKKTIREIGFCRHFDNWGSVQGMKKPG